MESRITGTQRKQLRKQVKNKNFAMKLSVTKIYSREKISILLEVYLNHIMLILQALDLSSSMSKNGI